MGWAGDVNVVLTCAHAGFYATVSVLPLHTCWMLRKCVCPARYSELAPAGALSTAMMAIGGAVLGKSRPSMLVGCCFFGFFCGSTRLGRH